jgi:hypothetical protein
VLVKERVSFFLTIFKRPSRSVGLNLGSGEVQGVGSDLTKARCPDVIDASPTLMRYPRDGFLEYCCQQQLCNCRSSREEGQEKFESVKVTSRRTHATIRYKAKTSATSLIPLS